MLDFDDTVDASTTCEHFHGTVSIEIVPLTREVLFINLKNFNKANLLFHALIGLLVLFVIWDFLE
jgi:hypothetical protein